MDEPDIIAELKVKPFGSLRFEDKLLIVKNGRPCPELKNLTTVVKDRNKLYTRHFTHSNYDNHNWLCGSQSLIKLFCWPCVLFSKSNNVWVSSGFSNLSGLSKSAKAHENSESHLQSVMDLYNFGRQTRVDESLNNALKINNNIHNKKVKKNREILKRLIDVTCFLAKQELPFRGHDEGATSFNKGNYIETLNLLRRWDAVLEEHFDSATVFKGTSSDIQNDLISIISEVVNEAILQEVRQADFVAIMLDETSDIKSRSQLSTVLRYVHEDNCVKERFIKFNDVSADRTADGLFLHVKNVINDYKIADKLIGQTYDGAAVMSGHLSGLQKKVLEEYPTALHTHCYAHILNLVLAQGMNEISECNIFFSTLNGIATFSSHSSKRSFAVQEHLKKSIPSFVPTRWSFTSRLVNTIENFLTPIINFFTSISENYDKWNGPDRCTARGYVDFLNKFETIFLLNLFSPLFSQSDILFRMLQTENIDIMECLNYVKDFHQYLKHLRQGVIHCNECQEKLLNKIISEEDKCNNCEIVGFEVIWEKTVSVAGLPVLPRNKRRGDIEDQPEKRYRKLYFCIIDNITNHLTARFSSLRNLAFFEILNPRKFEKFSSKDNFPESLIDDLGRLFPNVFDICGLKNELYVFYRTSAFRGKSPHILIKFLKDENLDQSFKQIFRLAKLIVTIPATTASVERSFSALKRIHTYKRSTQSEDRMNNLSILSIEKEMLESLREKEHFYSIVIDKFVTKTRRLDYIYK